MSLPGVRDRSGSDAQTFSTPITLAYAAGLMLSFVGLCAAYPTWPTVTLAAASLATLWRSFVCRHGREVESSRQVASALRSYPSLLLQRITLVPLRAISGFSSFAIALAVQAALGPSLQGTVWVESLPYTALLGLHFAAITLYRLVIFVHHAMQVHSVDTFLDARAADRPAAERGLKWICHGLITGLTTHACLLIVPTLWWRMVSPSLLMEATLLVCWFMMMHLPTVRHRRQDEFLRLAHADHAGWHANRPLFALFHVHHHDAIPSGLIASHGVGLLEASHRMLLSFDWLGPCSAFCWTQTVYIKEDMDQHQFIPGIFPGSSRVIERRNHHAVHHLGGVLPLGTGLLDANEQVDAAYRPDNPISSWFLAAVDAQEALNTVARARYLEAPSQVAAPIPPRIED